MLFVGLKARVQPAAVVKVIASAAQAPAPPLLTGTRPAAGLTTRFVASVAIFAAGVRVSIEGVSADNAI